MQGNMYILYIRVTSYFKVELASEHGKLTSDLLICIKILAMVLTSLFLYFFVSFTAVCAWKAGYSHHCCIYVFACVCLDKFSFFGVLNFSFQVQLVQLWNHFSSILLCVKLPTSKMFDQVFWLSSLRKAVCIFVKGHALCGMTVYSINL